MIFLAQYQLDILVEQKTPVFEPISIYAFREKRKPAQASLGRKTPPKDTRLTS